MAFYGEPCIQKAVKAGKIRREWYSARMPDSYPARILLVLNPVYVWIHHKSKVEPYCVYDGSHTLQKNYVTLSWSFSEGISGNSKREKKNTEETSRKNPLRNSTRLARNPVEIEGGFTKTLVGRVPGQILCEKFLYESWILPKTLVSECYLQNLYGALRFFRHIFVDGKICCS